VINWDKINDQLIALPGSRLKANMNGGTIPDRGYYGVYLAETNIRLGEMEEEFVFESKPGDIFYLGNSEWYLEKIAQDRIIVRPVSSTKPRPPFWKGDLGYMSFETAEKVGSFREKIVKDIATNTSVEKMSSEYDFDPDITKNLIKFFKSQQSITGDIPTNKKIIVEWFYDAADELNIVFHTPYGGRVNAPWAISISGYLEKNLSSEIQYSFDDDGFILRVRASTEFPDIQNLLKLKPDQIERLLHERISSAPIFSIQFRYNAARALLLARSRPGKRIPLWLQRLRSTDLLQAVKKYPDFPILTETYRSRLPDVFDLNALKSVIDNINQGKISTNLIQTPHPSPMVSGLIFDFVSNQVYEQDRTLVPGEIATVSSDLLSQVIVQEKIPPIITNEIIFDLRQRWQHLTHESKAKDKEELFLIIKKLGPISEDDLSKRSHEEMRSWLDKLKSENRISNVTFPVTGYVVSEDLTDFENIKNDESLSRIIRRHLESEGPVSVQFLKEAFSLSSAKTEQILSILDSGSTLVKGDLIKDSIETFWCDRDNFAQLYRRAISIRRAQITSVKRHTYLRFLLNWHSVTGSQTKIDNLISLYQGLPFPPGFFEREILASRAGLSKSGDGAISPDLLGESIQNGELIIYCQKSGPETRNLIKFIRRGDGNLFDFSLSEDELQNDMSPDEQIVYRFLKENGASHFQDIEYGTELSPIQIRDVLQKLVQNGLITSDNYNGFLTLIATGQKQTSIPSGRSSRHSVKQKVKNQILLKSGRWFLTSSFAVMGKKISTSERLERQVRLLLNRYGILVKEFYRREVGFLPWYQLFQVLKRLEWQGEIRRGYFIEGLSGVQYALPEAVETLSSLSDIEPDKNAYVLSTIDPALPFGGNVNWDIKNEKGDNVEIRRSSGNHLIFLNEEPSLYTENYANRILILKSLNNKNLETALLSIKSWLKLPEALRPKKKIEIELINNKPATQSVHADIFYKIGFEREGSTIVLWPSGL
jgi:ATP-dependent Lhr-like helicase